MWGKTYRDMAGAKADGGKGGRELTLEETLKSIYLDFYPP